MLQDFLRNNRGINDGGDLPQDYMEAVYDRIVNNEIKMKVWFLNPVTANCAESVNLSFQSVRILGPVCH